MISLAALPSPISKSMGTLASALTKSFIAARTSLRLSPLASVDGLIDSTVAYAVTGTGAHTWKTAILDSYHRAMATAWSSARRETSEKSTGQRMRRISIMGVLQRCVDEHCPCQRPQRQSAERWEPRPEGWWEFPAASGLSTAEPVLRGHRRQRPIDVCGADLASEEATRTRVMRVVSRGTDD